MHALEQITTAECRRLGMEVTRDTVLPSIRPILEAALRRTHATPASIFERLDVMLRMVVPDQTAVYRSIDERSGEVVLGWPYTPHGATLEVWAGVLQVGIELCGRSGEVHIAGQPDAHRALRGVLELGLDMSARSRTYAGLVTGLDPAREARCSGALWARSSRRRQRSR